MRIKEIFYQNFQINQPHLLKIESKGRQKTMLPLLTYWTIRQPSIGLKIQSVTLAQYSGTMAKKKCVCVCVGRGVGGGGPRYTNEILIL